MIRRAVPWTLLPLTILAGGLSAAPWLRAFPADVMAVPLFGAAVLSVLVPVVAVPLLGRRLWLTALVDVVAFALYALLVVLHSPGGVGDLVDGLVHGPAQVLSFALPLVSPRSLLVAPVALCWLAGAVAGECLARRWFSVLPYLGWLVSFGLAYAATERAAVADAGQARLQSTLLAVGLLVTVLVLRSAQAWVQQDLTAEATQAEGILPLRGLVAGVGVAALVAAGAALAVQAPAFVRPPATPQRVPPLDRSQPVTPLSFVAGLRPSSPTAPGRDLFTVSTDAAAPGYFGIASVDLYDGDGWSFARTFRPSGGVVPADPDPALRDAGLTVTQRYRVDGGPLTRSPWMPALYRAGRVTGTAVNVDPGSGMVVPAAPLSAGASFTVTSRVATTPFEDLPPTSLPATSAPPVDTGLPGGLRATLGSVVSALADEVGTPSTSTVPFLQALVRDLRARYSLIGATTTGAPPAGSSSPAARRTARSGSRTAARKGVRSARPSPVVSSVSAPAPRPGGTAFADVFASILGPQRAATPEQYATLFALVARQLGVPARVVTGFRVAPGGAALPPGAHSVTTADAWTWVEIPVRDSGWVVVDPSPGTYSAAQQQPTVGSHPSQSPTAPPTQAALITSGNAGNAVAPKSTVPATKGRSTGSLVLAVLAALAVLLVLLVVGLLLRKTRRRARRRGAPDPRRRLLGAWHESLDVLTECGLPDLTSLTSTEIAAVTAEHFGPEPGEHARYLGHVANTAMYSPSTPIGAAEADAAWRSHTTLRALVRRRLGVGARLRSTVAYHRTRAAAPSSGPASWVARERAGRSTPRGRHARPSRGGRRH